jgi:hypothetical protein
MKRMFALAAIATVGSFVFLIGFHSFVTAPVELDTNETVYFVVGFEQPPSPPCLGLGDSDCIRTKLTVNHASIG